MFSREALADEVGMPSEDGGEEETACCEVCAGRMFVIVIGG